MTSSVEDDYGNLWPWAVDEVAETWNKYFAEPFKFRIFTHKGTAAADAKRLTGILRANAHWLGCRKNASIDELYDAFCTLLLIASVKLQDAGFEAINQGLSRPMQRTMGFWAFTRPDLQNLAAIAEFDADAEGNRRREKAAAMRELSACWKEAERVIAYRLRDPASIRRLLPVVQRALASIEDAIEQEAWMDG